MSASTQLEDYVSRFRQRLNRLATARGVAMLGVAALLVSVVAVEILSRLGFPGNLLTAARFVLIGVLATLTWFAVLRPHRRVDDAPAPAIEQHAPAFAGRIEAWADTRETHGPLRELLAEETIDIAQHFPPERQIAGKKFNLAIATGALSLAALLFIAIAGPGNYAYGVRSLWLGWALPGILPAQNIEVSPGDDGIRLGGNVRIRGVPRGFEPREVYLHARFGDGDWQQVPMSPDGEGYEFTFFSVRQPLEYFVAASNVRSPTFEVQVVDLPEIDRLALTIRFPDWTGREPETRDPGGDVRAIAGAEVEVRVTADRPMTPGALIVDDREIALATDGEAGTARFTIDGDGQYYVAATVGGERIRLTDDYFITMLEDEAPTVEFERPGRDWNASRIEEVTARVRAEDDFAIESLLLRYSVNGGEWTDVALDPAAENTSHVFFLESLGDSGGPLEPGDLVAYYAVAGDREQGASSDIFFIDVQPFDRRYSQAQAAGGGGMQGQQGESRSEVSDRQREIIISTWNLIRERDGRSPDDAYVSDNAALLARVQETLRGQVTTLAERSRARRMTLDDDDVARFVEHLDKAAEAMSPASEKLGNIELDDALLPEQEALRHLLAAEAVFNDISVSMQAGNTGGGGGQAGQELAEMFELEMDLEKNQYETGSAATPDTPQQELEQAADELDELARRQERLARNQDRSPTTTPEQRWQQEKLRRDVEDLQERLEAMAEAGGEPGAAASSASAGSAPSRNDGIGELQRRLASAARAMDEAGAAMRDDGDLAMRQRAMEEAQRQLAGARDSAEDAGRRATQASLDLLGERAASLHEDQANVERTLQDAIRSFLDVGDQPFGSGMTVEQEAEVAEEKRRILSDLRDLDTDTRRAAQQLDGAEPRTAADLRDALDKLREQEIEARIAVAAAYIEQGEAIYVVSSESAVTDALRQLSDDLERAGRQLGGTAAAVGSTQDGLQRALSEARELRRDLQQLADGAETAQGGTGDNADIGRLAQRADAVGNDVAQLSRASPIGDLDAQDVEDLQQLGEGLRNASSGRNDQLLAEEARKSLSVVEKLELELARATRSPGDSLRSSTEDEIPESRREIVADYYRRLARSEQETD